MSSPKDVETADPDTGMAMAPTPVQDNHDKITVIQDLDVYEGGSLEAKVDAMIRLHGVVVFSKTWCPFCRDAKDFLATQMGVRIHVIEVDNHPNGSQIFSYLSKKNNHYTVPMVFIKENFLGGCEDVKSLHKKGELETKYLKGLVERKQTVGSDHFDTANLVPVERSFAANPPFWFPNTVNTKVIRTTGVLICILSALSAAFHWKLWARYLAVALLVDFAIRVVVGGFLSPIGMIANVLTSPFTPEFAPGPPKQFAACCGVIFSLLGTIFYFLDFKGHDIVGAIWMGMLAGAAGLEGFLGFCLGCVFYQLGIQFGLIPDYYYRIYTATREETVQSWNYMFLDSNAPKPIKVDTDPNSPVALKYKKKTAEWTKDDFDLIRNMQVSYFAMPLAITGLSVAFKIASSWSTELENRRDHAGRTIIVPKAWFQVIASLGSASFCCFLMLYVARFFMYRNKCMKEWDCPLRSAGFGMISITLMLFAFILYDEIKYEESSPDEAPQVLARVVWWIGASSHAALTVVKFGEWVARRLEMEHVHPHWMVFPVGLAVAALVGPVVMSFELGAQPSVANALLARFFYSFAWLMWITLFIITFFKVVTGHNSDDRLRHGVFIWVAAPCALALAEWVICFNEAGFSTRNHCDAEFSNKFFIGVFIFLGLLWATLPGWNFFGRDTFGMGYWIECFALDTLAICGAFFYVIYGYRISENVQFIGLTIASIANLTALMHTISAIIRRRGVFTPEVKWGPLSFMILTHEAFRGNVATLRHYLDVANVESETQQGIADLHLFAAHLNRFRIMHDEHSKHEDLVIFKTFNDYFPEHATKWNTDHEEHHTKFHKWTDLANQMLDKTLDIQTRKAALDEIKGDLPGFLVELEEHLVGEELNLQPVGRKHIPLAITMDISRKVWDLTPANKWEIIIPFVLNNVPRQMQRVRYLKVLCWSMPERAQQIGAIVYRNVDAVMWELLSFELPEIIPRGVPGWKRYY